MHLKNITNKYLFNFFQKNVEENKFIKHEYFSKDNSNFYLEKNNSNPSFVEIEKNDNEVKVLEIEKKCQNYSGYESIK